MPGVLILPSGPFSGPFFSFSLWVAFSWLFACLVISDWMSDIVSFTLLVTEYFCAAIISFVPGGGYLETVLSLRISLLHFVRKDQCGLAQVYHAGHSTEAKPAEHTSRGLRPRGPSLWLAGTAVVRARPQGQAPGSP